MSSYECEICYSETQNYIIEVPLCSQECSDKYMEFPVNLCEMCDGKTRMHSLEAPLCSIDCAQAYVKKEKKLAKNQKRIGKELREITEIMIGLNQYRSKSKGG